MIVLGLVFVLVGWLTKIHLLSHAGWLLLIVGLVLLVLGGVGRPVGGRRVWW